MCLNILHLSKFQYHSHVFVFELDVNLSRFTKGPRKLLIIYIPLSHAYWQLLLRQVGIKHTLYKMLSVFYQLLDNELPM